MLPPVAKTGFGAYQIHCDEYPKVAPTFAMTVGTQTLFADTHQYRKIIEPEIIFGGLIGSPNYIRNSHSPDSSSTQITNIAIGWTFFDSSSHYHGNGPQIRYIWTYPQIDLQGSIYWRYVDYIGPTTLWKAGYGARLDLGFSYVTGYMQFGRDLGFYQDGVARRADVLQLGFMVQFPLN